MKFTCNSVFINSGQGGAGCGWVGLGSALQSPGSCVLGSHKVKMDVEFVSGIPASETLPLEWKWRQRPHH